MSNEMLLEQIRTMLKEEIIQAIHASEERMIKRMDQMESRLTERMDALEKRMDHLEMRMDHLENRMDQLDEKLEEISTAVNVLGEDISKIETAQESHQISIRSLEFRTTNLEARVV